LKRNAEGVPDFLSGREFSRQEIREIQETVRGVLAAELEGSATDHLLNILQQLEALGLVKLPRLCASCSAHAEEARPSPPPQRCPPPQRGRAHPSAAYGMAIPIARNRLITIPRNTQFAASFSAASSNGLQSSGRHTCKWDK